MNANGGFTFNNTTGDLPVNGIAAFGMDGDRVGASLGGTTGTGADFYVAKFGTSGTPDTGWNGAIGAGVTRCAMYPAIGRRG